MIKRVIQILKELSQLTQLRRAVRFASDPVAGSVIDEFAREMSTLKPGDPRRVERNSSARQCDLTWRRVERKAAADYPVNIGSAQLFRGFRS
jgi:hypothetical protein